MSGLPVAGSMRPETPLSVPLAPPVTVSCTAVVLLMSRRQMLVLSPTAQPVVLLAQFERSGAAPTAIVVEPPLGMLTAANPLLDCVPTQPTTLLPIPVTANSCVGTPA